MNCDKNVRCWLVAVDRSHEDIELPDGMPVSIGRSASTNITDTQVSRLHGNNNNDDDNNFAARIPFGHSRED